MSKPSLSIIVVCHDMRREAPRTLFSLSRAYQRGIDELDYEVLVVDNGSSKPLDEAQVESFGREFNYWFHATESPSPVVAINAAVRRTSGEYVVVCIDGARILSPGMLRFMSLGLRLVERPVVASLAWHLGGKIQKVAMLEGYGREEEDKLLATVDWKRDGYELFRVSCLANSSRGGWFRPIAESNCIGIPRTVYGELGGFDEAFASSGGGYANMDFYKRACEAPGTTLITLLGEGTFHQFHGGAATNARPEVNPGPQFAQEYERLRGRPYAKPEAKSIYLGSLPPQSGRFLLAQVGS